MSNNLNDIYLQVASWFLAAGAITMLVGYGVGPLVLTGLVVYLLRRLYDNILATGSP